MKSQILKFCLSKETKLFLQETSIRLFRYFPGFLSKTTKFVAVIQTKQNTLKFFDSDLALY